MHSVKKSNVSARVFVIEAVLLVVIAADCERNDNLLDKTTISNIADA